MSKLVIRALRCVEETDEIGSDDAYIALFRGSFSLPPDLKVVGGNGTPWGNMTSGKLVVHDMVLDDTYQAQNVYVAALIDQDRDNPLLPDKKVDLSDGSHWAAALNSWTKFWPAHAGNPSMLQALAIFALTIGGGLKNDTPVDAKVIAPIFKTGGIGQLLIYDGEGGHYRARAVLRA